MCGVCEDYASTNPDVHCNPSEEYQSALSMKRACVTFTWSSGTPEVQMRNFASILLALLSIDTHGCYVFLFVSVYANVVAILMR